MENTELIKELQASINTIYYVMTTAKETWIEDELYPVVYKLERVISELENE